MFNLFLVASLLMGAATYGRASQYAEGVMDRVIENRIAWEQIPKDLDKYAGFIAVRDCSNVGEEYYLYHPALSRPVLVLATDCASKSDRQSDTDLRSGYEWMLDGNILVEMDYDLAERLGTVGEMTWIYLREVENTNGK